MGLAYIRPLLLEPAPAGPGRLTSARPARAVMSSLAVVAGAKTVKTPSTQAGAPHPAAQPGPGQWRRGSSMAASAPCLRQAANTWPPHRCLRNADAPRFATKKLSSSEGSSLGSEGGAKGQSRIPFFEF